ncbi:hypothetical protein TRAPUB_3480 [Trametes pubescens]|uniref:F-box domain-containing protein n=1 Tax=Trametes pubescens TaxID=154538 RepID=A0A1M2VDL5_TRAPU|nr:hypothetical protein TRAPUB_3480 [Trametes pubescens]
MTAVLRYVDVGTQAVWNYDSPLSHETAISTSVLSRGSITNSHSRRHQSSTSSSSILQVNEDVFALIVEELLEPKGDTDGSLKRLSLFVEDPRPKTVPGFCAALLYLPHVRSIKFACASHGVQWGALKRFLSFPQVKSISFTASATFTYVPPFPEDPSSTASTLEELFYPTPLVPKLPLTMTSMTTWAQKVALERDCLSALVLGMRSTARSLVLPMMTAPLRAMAEADWPALQDLYLGGSFPNTTDRSFETYLQSMLPRMPDLRHLVAMAALPRANGSRCCLLAGDPSPSVLQNLRSLVVAYPHPSDPIFAIPFPDLTHLSLRDWPRHYNIKAQIDLGSLWTSPILSATEALSLLQRVHAPRLKTLELVYSADEADTDLLVLVAQSFPNLRHLTLHRYRRSADEIVDHRHIARTLARIPTLVTLQLHLDFAGDPGKYRDATERTRDPTSDVRRWPGRLAQYGWDILGAMAETCPLLEGVALLRRDEVPPSLWLWMLRGRQEAFCAWIDANW